MIIFLGILVILVGVCFFMIMSGNAEIEKLRQQNRQITEQLLKMKENYQNLLNAIKEAGLEISKKSVENGSKEEKLEVTQTQVVSPAVSKEEKINIVKENAQKLQGIVEGYAFDHDGYYPPDLKTLDEYASSTYMNEVITNPFTGKQAYATDQSVCIDITKEAIDEGLKENAGKLLFQANPDDNGKITSYAIAALDSEGMLIREDDGETIFTITK